MLFQRLVIGLTERSLLQKNPARTSLIIFNTHATATAYIHQTKGVGINGFPVLGGAAIIFKVPEDDVTSEIWIISDTADTDIRFYEGFGYLDERWFKP